ncbi:hypothetical protein, partial [Acinetobacter baumannii]|uniref:hypothetical protein n=1 Tax=Acinetobacter baumannii TaxID=470 RepID=UPI0024B78B9C
MGTPAAMNGTPPFPPQPPQPEHHRPGPPPRELPAVELWHRAQDHKSLAGLAASVGFILVVLGGVRVAFAFAERRYA